MKNDETQLGLMIRENGQPAADRWAVERVVISDPTGNVWYSDWSLPLFGHATTGSEELWAGVPDSLILDEPAYRVCIELARRKAYPPEDLWSIPGLKIPPPGRTVRLSRKRTVHGCKLEITQLGDGYTGLYIEGARYAGINVTGPVGRYCLRQLQRNHQDDEIFLIGTGPHWADASDAKTGRPFTLRLALTPRRTVEFLAHPSAAPQHASTQ